MVSFEFSGGPKDGEVVVHEGSSARGLAYFELTGGGRAGAILWCTTEYFLDVAEHLSDSALDDMSRCGTRLRGHLYEACVLWNGIDWIRIRMRHVGICPGIAERNAAVEQEGGAAT